MADFGYDVSNYTGIDPALRQPRSTSTRLLAAIHARGLKLILDFVPNHSSDQHPWFLESSLLPQSNPKRDWYLWHDPGPDGSAPNNWQSKLRRQRPGSLGRTPPSQSYFHSFLPQQPDLNWWNPDVKAKPSSPPCASGSIKGVDGFRMDVLWLLIKDRSTSAIQPTQPRLAPRRPQTSGPLPPRATPPTSPETHDHRQRDARPSSITYDRPPPDRRDLPPASTSSSPTTAPDASATTERPDTGSQTPRRATCPSTSSSSSPPGSPTASADLIRQYEVTALPPGAWPNWVLGNHDQSRLATRLGVEPKAPHRCPPSAHPPRHPNPVLRRRARHARHPHRARPDVQGPRRPPNQPGIAGQGRDPERTPMLWDATPKTPAFTRPGVKTMAPHRPRHPPLPYSVKARIMPSPRSAAMPSTAGSSSSAASHPALHAGPIIQRRRRKEWRPPLPARQRTPAGTDPPHPRELHRRRASSPSMIEARPRPRSPPSSISAKALEAGWHLPPARPTRASSSNSRSNPATSPVQKRFSQTGEFSPDSPAPAAGSPAAPMPSVLRPPRKRQPHLHRLRLAVRQKHHAPVSADAEPPPAPSAMPSPDSTSVSTSPPMSPTCSHNLRRKSGIGAQPQDAGRRAVPASDSPLHQSTKRSSAPAPCHAQPAPSAQPMVARHHRPRSDPRTAAPPRSVRS